jgi:hypothetical protein
MLTRKGHGACSILDSETYMPYILCMKGITTNAYTWNLILGCAYHCPPKWYLYLLRL